MVKKFAKFTPVKRHLKSLNTGEEELHKSKTVQKGIKMFIMAIFKRLTAKMKTGTQYICNYERILTTNQK